MKNLSKDVENILKKKKKKLLRRYLVQKLTKWVDWAFCTQKVTCTIDFHIPLGRIMCSTVGIT